MLTWRFSLIKVFCKGNHLSNVVTTTKLPNNPLIRFLIQAQLQCVVMQGCASTNSPYPAQGQIISTFWRGPFKSGPPRQRPLSSGFKLHTGISLGPSACSKARSMQAGASSSIDCHRSRQALAAELPLSWPQVTESESPAMAGPV